MYRNLKPDVIQVGNLWSRAGDRHRPDAAEASLQ